MFDTDGDFERQQGTLFRDGLSALLVLTLFWVAILLPWVNPPKEEDHNGQRARGNIRVEIMWPNDMDVDIDLWMMAPDQPSVGFPNKGGVFYNLVRDDLGSYADVTGINYEVGFSRGLPKGEHIINIHWYSNSAAVNQVPVRMIVTIQKDDSGNSKTTPQKLLDTTVILTSVNEEATGVRFSLNDTGDLVDGSVHTLFQRIRPIIRGDQ